MAKKKSKDVTYGKLTKHFFNTSTRTWLSNQAFKFLRKVTGISLIKGTACFSYVKRYGIGQQVAIGTDFFTTAIDKKKGTDIIPVASLKPTYKRMAVVYKAVFFHEIAHHLYTDMQLFTDMAEKLNSKSLGNFLGIFKGISNTIEDVVIEEEFSFYQPLIGKLLEYLRFALFDKAKIDSVEESFTDPKVHELDSLFNYILIRYRVPSKVKFEHPLYTKHKKDIHSGMYVCLKTSDPTKRVKRSLAYAYELYRLFILEETFELKEVVKGKDLKWIETLPDAPEPTVISGSAGSPLDVDEDTVGKASKAGGTYAPPTGKPHKKTSGSKADTDDIDDVSEEAKEEVNEGETKEVNAGKTTSPIAGGGEDGDGFDPTAGSGDRIIRNAANDEPLINFDHISMYCNDHVDNSKYLSRYDEIVKEYDEDIRRLVSVVKKILATNNNRYERHRKHGKLDKRKMTKQIVNTKLFKNKVAPKPVADLAMSFLVDNSGSMTGRKTKIVGRALIILQETCYRLGIPYEVNAFTEYGRTAITIEMKRFEDSHKEGKANAVIISDEKNISSMHTFYGNVDESNLDFVGKRFIENRKEKDKILIYMADGATCGSSDSLKHVGKRILDAGVSVLAIGIIDEEVKHSFPDNHIIFKDYKDLEKLSSTLQRFVFNKMFKGE